MKRRLALAITAIVLVLGAPSLAAAKGDPSPALRIHYVDDVAAGSGQVAFDYDGPAKDLSKVSAKVDGQSVKAGQPTKLTDSDVPENLLYVIDDSTNMGTPTNLAANRDALRSMISQAGAKAHVSVVSYGDVVHVLSTLDDSSLEAADAIKDLGNNQGDKAVLWDALHKGMAELGTLSPDSLNAVVLVTTGADTGSTSNIGAVRAQLSQLGAALYVVGLGQQGLEQTGLSALVQESGGQSIVATEKAAVAPTMTKMLDTLEHRYVVKVPFGTGTGQRDLDLQVGSSTAKVTFAAGTYTTGSTALAPVTVNKPFGPSFLQSDLAKYLALLGIALAIGGVTYGVAHLVTKDQTGLSAVLRPYSDGTGPGEDVVDDGAMAQTAILQRAVQMTEDFAERQGFLANVEGKLERADLPLRAAEAMFFWGAATVVLGLASLALLGLVVGLIITAIVAVLPVGILNFLASRRRKAFDGQLPDMLGLLSGSLRAGYSLMQGMEAVAQEVTEPMGKELRRVCTEARLGRDLEEALEGVAERMSSRDFEWAVMAIRIQREVGGNLAELLLTVAETMTHRERLRREVAALTAEGKISAIVLGILPPGLGLFMAVSNPDYMHGLVATSLGHILLGVAVVAMGIGFAWMKKIIEIEI